MYINGMVAEAALKTLGGKTDDKEALIKAMRAVSLADSPRGPFHFDHFGNVVGNVYIRRVVKRRRQAGAAHDQDLPERQPVLDLRREVVPGAAGLFARLSAAEELMMPLPSCAAPCGGHPRVAVVSARRLRMRRSTAGHDGYACRNAMNLWLILSVNSVTLGGLLFLLSAGFSLIFGLMRIPNLTHGSMFMLGAYFGVTLIAWGFGFWIAALLAPASALPLFGGIVERFVLRRLVGRRTGAGAGHARPVVHGRRCLPDAVGRRPDLGRYAGRRCAAPRSSSAWRFPTYRLVIIVIAVAIAAALWGLLDRTRLGAMIRAAVDDPAMARAVGIRVSQLFTIVFCLGAGLAGFAGVIGGPILSVYPGLDQDMLPLALVVVILGGTGSLLGSLVGSFVVGFLYNFGQAMFPELAYVVLFLPMLIVLVVRPQGLFGRAAL